MNSETQTALRERVQASRQRLETSAARFGPKALPPDGMDGAILTLRAVESFLALLPPEPAAFDSGYIAAFHDALVNPALSRLEERRAAYLAGFEPAAGQAQEPGERFIPIDRADMDAISPCGHYMRFRLPCIHEDGTESMTCMQCDCDRAQAALEAVTAPQPVPAQDGPATPLCICGHERNQHRGACLRCQLNNPDAPCAAFREDGPEPCPHRLEFQIAEGRFKCIDCGTRFTSQPAPALPEPSVVLCSTCGYDPTDVGARSCPACRRYRAALAADRALPPHQDVETLRLEIESLERYEPAALGDEAVADMTDDGPYVLRSAVLAALARRAPADQGWRETWQPMETVPKDGRTVIIDFDRVGVTAVFWSEEPFGKGIGAWCVSDNKNEDRPLRGYCEGDERGWMPMPAALQRAREGAKP